MVNKCCNRLVRNNVLSCRSCRHGNVTSLDVTYASVESLCSGRFHNHLRDVFAPHVVRYVDLMESSIAQSIHKGFEKESWKPQGSLFLHCYHVCCYGRLYCTL